VRREACESRVWRHTTAAARTRAALQRHNVCANSCCLSSADKPSSFVSADPKDPQYLVALDKQGGSSACVHLRPAARVHVHSTGVHGMCVGVADQVLALCVIAPPAPVVHCATLPNAASDAAAAAAAVPPPASSRSMVMTDAQGQQFNCSIPTSPAGAPGGGEAAAAVVAAQQQQQQQQIAQQRGAASAALPAKSPFDVLDSLSECAGGWSVRATVLAATLQRAACCKLNLPCGCVRLAPPAAGLCLYRQDGLWTYEVCHKKHVRQFRQVRCWLGGKRTRSTRPNCVCVHTDTRARSSACVCLHVLDAAGCLGFVSVRSLGNHCLLAPRSGSPKRAGTTPSC
jgi:hypothetical protein